MKELRKTIAQLEHDRQAIRRSLRESDKGLNHDNRFERSERLLRLETIEAELDEKQGRITIEQHLLDYANIDRDVVAVRVGQYWRLIAGDSE
jgi:DNA-binding transcriptional regulator/RsmH inhibitor MraZ